MISGFDKCWLNMCFRYMQLFSWKDKNMGHIFGLSNHILFLLYPFHTFRYSVLKFIFGFNLSHEINVSNMPFLVPYLTLWRFRHGWVETVHMVASITVITEQKLVLEETRHKQPSSYNPLISIFSSCFAHFILILFCVYTHNETFSWCQVCCVTKPWDSGPEDVEVPLGVMKMDRIRINTVEEQLMIAVLDKKSESRLRWLGQVHRWKDSKVKASRQEV